MDRYDWRQEARLLRKTTTNRGLPKIRGTEEAYGATITRMFQQSRANRMESNEMNILPRTPIRWDGKPSHYETAMICTAFLAHKRESRRCRPASRLTGTSVHASAASADALRFIASELHATSGLRQTQNNANTSSRNNNNLTLTARSARKLSTVSATSP